MAWDRLVLLVVCQQCGRSGSRRNLARVDVHDRSHASGSAEVLGYEVSPANSYCSGTGRRIARIRPVARTDSSRRRIGGPAMELVNGHEYFLALSNRGALSIFDASFKLFGCRGAMVNRAHGTESIREDSILFG